MGFSSTQKDVEADSASIERRFLRNKRNVLAVFLNVELGNVLAIKLNEFQY